MSSEDKSLLSIPHDFEAEQAVLGTIIFENKIILELMSILVPNSFHEEHHRHIYRAMLELVKKDLPIDEIILGDQLKEIGKLEEIGGYAYLAELVECVPTAGNFIYYAKIIQEHALLRDLIATTADIGRKSRDPEQSVSELLIEADEKINEIQRRIHHKSYRGMKDILQVAFDNLEETSKNKRRITGLETGFIDLDQITSGLQPSDLIIIAARPSMGKTGLAINMATQVASRNRSKGAILIFSLEMSAEQLVMRMLASESRISLTKLRIGNLNQDDWDRLAKATDMLSTCPIYINDDTDLSPQDIVAITKKLDKEFENGVSLVIMDYIQLANGNKKLPREQQIAEISRSLKGLAKKQNIPVIALSQLNRMLENRTDKRPKLSDLRESGSLEQDPDIILFIYRDEIYNEDSDKKGIAEIIIAKHRNGPTGYIELVFKGEYTKFANMSRLEPPENYNQ